LVSTPAASVGTPVVVVAQDIVEVVAVAVVAGSTAVAADGDTAAGIVVGVPFSCVKQNNKL